MTRQTRTDRRRERARRELAGKGWTAIVAGIAARRRAVVLARAGGVSVDWSPAVLAAIEWRRFEAVCETFFAQAGLATRSQSHGADGGVDIWLQSRHMDAPRIVQCKHWQGKPVGVKEVREFRGVMASHQIQSGTYVISSTFTADAIAFAKSVMAHLSGDAATFRGARRRLRCATEQANARQSPGRKNNVILRGHR